MAELALIKLAARAGLVHCIVLESLLMSVDLFT